MNDMRSAERALVNCTNLDSIKRGLKVTTDKQLMDFLKQHNPELCQIIPMSRQEAWRLVLIDRKFTVIDEQLADLISKINRWGFTTRFCCCGGHPTRGGYRSLPIYYIQFKQTDKTERLAFEVFNRLAAVKVAKPEEEHYVFRASTNRLRNYPKERNGISVEYSAYIDRIQVSCDEFKGEKRVYLGVHYKDGYRDKAISDINNLVETISNSIVS